MSQKQRRSIRLRGYDYTRAGAYFVTICTRDRACLFGKVVDGKMRLNDSGVIVDKAWRAIPVHFPQAAVDEFAMTPNHIHDMLMFDVGAPFMAPPTTGQPWTRNVPNDRGADADVLMFNVGAPFMAPPTTGQPWTRNAPTTGAPAC